MNSLKLGFAGSPFFAERILQLLLDNPDTKEDLLLVLTQPGRKKGRGQKISRTPVEILAKANNIAVFNPPKLDNLERELHFALKGLDLLIVVAYGLMIPLKVLRLPRLGCVNIHPSLLPKWRGAAPIQRSIEYGDKETGVCLMQMVEKLDSGPVWAKKTIPISIDDTLDSLQSKLIDLSFAIVIDFIKQFEFGHNLKPLLQNDIGISYAFKINKKETLINWESKALDVHNKIRAFDSEPGSFTFLNGKRIKMNNSKLIDRERETGSPGEILGIQTISGNHEYLVLACSEGMIGIGRLKRDSGKWVNAREFFNGLKNKTDIKFANS